MNLSLVSDSDLLENIKRLAAEERKITLQVLHHLHEIDTRKLHLEQGFASLFDYCVGALGYSESAAYRRISAMRLLRELPSVEKKIEEGKVTLTNISQLQVFFKSEKKNHKAYDVQQKEALLTSLEGKSTRECEKVLRTLSPQSLTQERCRTLTEDITELKIILSCAAMKKLQRVQSLHSHKLKDLSWAALLEFLTDELLKRTDPELKNQPKPSLPAPVLPSVKSRAIQKTKMPYCQSVQVMNPPPTLTATRTISAHLRREVWRRDRGQCTYRNPHTDTTCGAKQYLEIDHIQPYALGGKTEISNLRLLCHAHNAYRAEKTFTRQWLKK